MLKILIPFIYAFLLLHSSHLFAAQLGLKIESKSIKPGKIHVALYRLKVATQSPAGWSDIEDLRKEVIDYIPNSAPSELNITGLESGQICVRVFIDLNANQLLDSSQIGLPLEPVGFANNPSLFSGQPSPEEGCFELMEGSNVQSIDLKQKESKRKRRGEF